MTDIPENPQNSQSSEDIIVETRDSRADTSKLEDRMIRTSMSVNEMERMENAFRSEFVETEELTKNFTAMEKYLFFMLQEISAVAEVNFSVPLIQYLKNEIQRVEDSNKVKFGGDAEE